MKRLTFALLLFLVLGSTLTLLHFQGLMGAEAGKQKETQRLRREWQRLAAEAKRKAEAEIGTAFYCCVVDPCTYCLLNKEDGLCTCANDLSLGKEICPECLGKWLNGRGAMYAWPNFRGVYPGLARWLVSQGGPPAQCPMMAGRGGMMGGPMGMMRGMMGRMFGWRRRGSLDWLKERKIELMMKARELKILSDYNCCMAGGGSCTYCILDPSRTARTICDCKDSLKAGRSICPECLGVWASGEGNPELKEAFQRVYPSLSRLIVWKGLEE